MATHAELQDLINKVDRVMMEIKEQSIRDKLLEIKQGLANIKRELELVE